ncbi:hypothetical protein DH2020_001207 [Rehmannia glutinosa]|uniref:Uncharacterized protein n=1 Tax=Rehmannia glutinosa TaxID=99300 RepID=A0ABR0XYS5_REHGL
MAIRHIGVADSEEIHSIVIGKSYKASVFCCFYIFSVHVFVLGFDGVGLIREAALGEGRKLDWTVVLLPAALSLAWFVLSFSVLYCKNKAAEKFPLLLRIWWIASFVICLFTLYADGRGFLTEGSGNLSSHVLANFVCYSTYCVFIFIATRGVTGIQVCRISDLQEPLLLEEESGCLKVTPYNEAGLFSLVILSWLNPLLSIGAKKPLELKDIPLLAPKDRPKTNYKERSWLQCTICRVNTLVSYVGPYMISYFVDYLGGKETSPHKGYVLAGIFFTAKLVETLATRQWYLGVDILGMHVRSALTAMVYRKGLRLSSSARKNHTSGEIVNYMAVDVQRVGDYSWYLHDIWMLPLQIILALAILYKNVGVASVATLIATIVSIVATVPVARIQEDYQDKLMAAKDDRMRKTSECLRNMRILKLQAWEDRYRVKLEEMRSVEFKYLRKALYSQAFITFIFWSSPIFVSAITFGTCVLLGGQLTAGSVLSALATFRILQEPLRNFPDLVSMMAQTKVSLDRIAGFLQEEELQEDATIPLPRDISNVKICGSAAYVSQSAWIQSGNIEENILFGSPMDKAKYKSVIHAVLTEERLGTILQTIIGDRGINLSGGQKQRLQLARALYQDADIYLLDDPLVLKEGRIIQAGKYDELLQAGTDFSALVSAHHEAIEAMDFCNLASEESDKIDPLDRSVLMSKKCDSVGNNMAGMEEEREHGKVSMKVYLSYMTAAYKGLLIPLIILAQTLFQVLQIASSWWMAWANPQTAGDKPKTSSMMLIGVYMALAFGSSWFIFVRAVLVATFGLAAAQKLFLKMLRSVFRAPMSFFDSTPAGRILNRVSIDQNVVDLDIPFRLGGFASTTIQLLGIVGVMTQVTWQILLLVIPMAIACLWMQLLNGFVSAWNCSQRLYLLLHGLTCMAGLAVTYGLNMNARLSRWILSFCKLENKIISIERIHQYSQITSEAPTLIDDTRPPSSWPVHGTIELIDLKVRYKESLPVVLHSVSCVFLVGRKLELLDELEVALDKSQLGEIIRQKEHKLDTAVIENGDNWSVGQRQLVSLGRALLKQSRILVLDEATASVDSATDNLIQKIIRTEFKNCTVCTVAHRIPTVIDSDLVLVLSDGRVAEFDSPLRLLEDKSSMFLKLVSEYSSRSNGIPDF